MEADPEQEKERIIRTKEDKKKINGKWIHTKEGNKGKGTESTIDQDQPKYMAEMGKSLRKIKRRVHSWASQSTHYIMAMFIFWSRL